MRGENRVSVGWLGGVEVVVEVRGGGWREGRGIEGRGGKNG